MLHKLGVSEVYAVSGGTYADQLRATGEFIEGIGYTFGACCLFFGFVFAKIYIHDAVHKEKMKKYAAGAVFFPMLGTGIGKLMIGIAGIWHD